MITTGQTVKQQQCTDSDKQRTASNASYIITPLYDNSKTRGVRLKRVNNYPMALSDCFSSVANGHLIVGGGKDDFCLSHNDVHRYHPGTDEWKSLPNMNMPRYGAKSCYAGKTLFVLGGCHDYHGELDSVEYLKIDASSQSACWMMCQSPLPWKLIGHEVTAIGDNIYLTFVDKVFSSKAFHGKISTDGDDILWRPLAPMLNGRHDHISFALQNKLFVAGGLGKGDNSCECYDPQTDKWTLMSYQLPYNRLLGACATSDGNGNVIITGGMRGHKLSSKVISFDLENGFKDIDDFEMYEPIARHVALPLM